MSTQPTYCKLKGQKLIYAVTFCCSIGFMLFGLSTNNLKAKKSTNIRPGYDLGFMGGLSLYYIATVEMFC
jgi:hypothetical protein